MPNLSPVTSTVPENEAKTPFKEHSSSPDDATSRAADADPSASQALDNATSTAPTSPPDVSLAGAGLPSQARPPTYGVITSRGRLRNVYASSTASFWCIACTKGELPALKTQPDYGFMVWYHITLLG